MSSIQFWVLLGVTLGGFLVLGLALRRQRFQSVQDEVLRRLSALDAGLNSSFQKATADMAARVEQVKGDLRTDLTERLQHGLNVVRETVERQLVDGRSEQSQQLGAIATALELRFEALRGTTETRLDQMSGRQEGASKEARAELARSLSDSTLALQRRFEAFEQRTGQHLDSVRARVDERLQAISDQVQQKLERNIQEGFAHFQKVQEHLKAAEEQLRSVGTVGQSINELNNLLKLPHLRGRFGEAELGRLLADFLPIGSFEEQAMIVPGSRERVDAVVIFPKFRLPIDSKFNREQILPLFETSDPQQIEGARQQLASAIRQQARDIADKYIHPEHGTTDLALMFLPSETVYFEVVRNGDLADVLHRLRVFPVSPNTLAITLRTIAMSISQYEFARGVEKTLEQIRAAQANFGHFQKKFEDVGRGLDRAQEAFHTASGHLNRYANRVVQLTGETIQDGVVHDDSAQALPDQGAPSA
ncbi:MAG: DNA recombination protein RmuC [Limisphaerales bacterium]